ncbi:MAG: M23 family metallopeptidase [Luteimonas sp.]
MKTLLVLLIGALIGANVVYFAMTRGHFAQVANPAPIATTGMPSQLPATMPIPASEVPGIAVSKTAPTTVATLPGAPTSPTSSTMPAQVNISGLIVPVSGVASSQLTDTFGDVRDGARQHQALDIMASAGTPVVAAADGAIEKLFESKLGGLTIYQFEPSGRYAYYYAHLQRYAPGLAEKQTVKQGDVIGYVGSTGNANPAAPHLHFAIFALGPERQWWKGTPINPYPLLSGRPSAGK